jgi:uncharacterized membrane protein YcaP (DUF421 family)
MCKSQNNLFNSFLPNCIIMRRLCEYKNIVGEPRKGIHSIRLFDFAIIDILGTVGLAFILSKITGISFLLSFLIWILIAIFLHWLFCVDTKLNMYIFG